MATNKDNQSRRPSLAELAARAVERQTAGADAAQLVLEGEVLSPIQIEALRDEARLSKETESILKELEGANEQVLKDPYARREWLRSKIEGLLSEDEPDPEKVMALMFAAMAKRLEGGAPALNLFTERPIKEHQRWPQKVFLPIARRKQDGTLQTKGTRMLVPSSGEDEPALRAFRAARRRAAETIIRRLEAECLVNFRRVVWQALYFIERSRITTKDEFVEGYTNGDTGVLRSEDGKNLNYFALSDDEVFVAPKSDLCGRLVVLLDERDLYAEEFWAGKFDVISEIRALVAANKDLLITPDQFLRGVVGIAAVYNDSWKKTRESKDLIEVAVIFERPSHDPSSWRWAVANPAAVDSLFHGKRLAYHDYTKQEIPRHVEHLLRHSTVIE